LPGSRSLAAAAYVLAGARSEGPAEAGTAHFLEHLTFKGTAAFPTSRAVSEAIEGLGGTSNAATDRESTTYWVHLPGREAARGIGLLGELICRPSLASPDVQREREVIVEEIHAYRDDASQYVFNAFDELFFGDTPLGREIAGDEDTVRGIPEAAIRAFWTAAYRPTNVVVAAVGDLPHEAVVEMVDQAFGRGDGERPVMAPAPGPLPCAGRLRVVDRPGTQAHLCLGLPALPRDDPGQWALEVLDTILGDGSSSRLFLQVREEAALAYDVHSFHVEYADCGALQVYAGVDPEDLPAAVRAILGELARLRDERVGPAEMAKAKAYARGRLELRLEESRNLVAWLGVQEALHDRVLSVDEAVDRLEAVDADEVAALAGRLFRDEALAMAVVMPRGRAAGLEAAFRLP
jgi:predicted Zn-dependent peptidase